MTDTTFLKRVGKTVENESGKTIDEIVGYYLSLDPSNKLSPNSMIYKIAVAKYNERVTSTERPPVPSWFCGFVDAETGLLVDNPDDSSRRVSAGFVVNPINEQTFSIVASGEYGIDKCLDLGLPGSFGYSNCVGVSGQDEDVELSGIDWEAQIASTSGTGLAGAEGGAGGGCSGPGGTGGEISLSNAKITGDGRTNAFLTFSCTGREQWPNKTLGSGGTCINGELRINGKKVDWLRPEQNSKDLENIFAGYNGWTPPSSGSSVTVSVHSVDGKYSASTGAKWP